MNHLDFNLQSGVILNNNSPVAIYNRHKNMIIIKKDYPNPVKDQVIIDYVYSSGVLNNDGNVVVKYTTALSVGFMKNEDFMMESI